MKQRKTLIIWRDDHLADPLGALFLTEPEKLEDSIVEKLREYLGARVRVVRVTVSGRRVEAEVESQGLHEESRRLVAVANGLRTKGLNRSAIATIKDALELDPLNGGAYRELGAILAAAGKGREALAALIRARETLGDSAELLIEIANACLGQERTSAASAYLERAHKLEPRNFLVRRSLSALGRKQRPSKIRLGESETRDAESASPEADAKGATSNDSGRAEARSRKPSSDPQLPLLGDTSEREQPPPARGDTSGGNKGT